MAATNNLIDQLPKVNLNILDLPEQLQRQLFDAFQLQIRYDRHRQQVTIKVAIRAEMIDSIGQTAAPRRSGCGHGRNCRSVAAAVAIGVGIAPGPNDRAHVTARVCRAVSDG